MKFPPYLSSGDKVAIVSPAGNVKRAVIERGAELLGQQGYQVEIGSHAFDEDGVFAGPDSARAADMQKALDDPCVRAIFFARGGYGSLRTHLRLDWTAFHQQPKWLAGFSDITVFHAYLSRRRIASVHGVMPSRFETGEGPTESFRKLIAMLSRRSSGQDLPPHPMNRCGSATGVLTGGNLSILQSLRGTALDIRPKGKILFIEDVHELHYHLDRMMRNLQSGGILEQISGLVVGHFTGIRDGGTPYGLTAYEIIRESVAPYSYPVMFGFPAGHDMPNHPLLMGGRMTLEVSSEGARMSYRNR